ncbi:MAG: respiratory nitrate reductase subunit gamma [Betaproteobacteria bacterium]
MSETLVSADVLLLVVAPYVAAVVFAIGVVERLRRHPYSCTSHSTQLLENRQHFWTVVPFHYGLLAVLLLHAVAFLAPSAVIAWNRSPSRLYALEIAALAAGLLATGGLLGAVRRRAGVPLVRQATAAFDWIVYAVLLAQFATGIAIAIRSSWGSAWMASVAAPYLWSLLRLRPDIGAVGALPLLVKAHIGSAFVLLAVFPFSRLIHVISVPNAYLWRRPLVVRWYRRRSASSEV